MPRMPVRRGTTRGRSYATWLAVPALVTSTLSGCATVTRVMPSGSEGTGDVPVTLTVLAAASLTDTFRQIGDAFEHENPGTRVVLSFGGSGALAQQVAAGAPADVLATASAGTMSIVADAGAVVGTPKSFARNRLQIAVPAGNPGGVEGAADLADPRLAVAMCAPEVPCGATAHEALAIAKVSPAVDTLERDVRAVLVKVRLGEVDAGLVYRTDVLAAAGDVEGVDFPEAVHVPTDYLVVALRDAPNPDAAAAFTAFVHTPAAKRIFAEAGFDVALGAGP